MEGGALNYHEKMSAISARFHRDFGDAISRLLAAEIGLREIYDYQVALPQTIKEYLKGTDQHEIERSALLDDAIMWVRDAIAWLIRFSEFDESFVSSISIRQALGDDAFSAGLSQRLWKFTVSGDLFPRQRQLRLRGASVYFLDHIVAKKLFGAWKVQVKPPEMGTTVRLDGKTDKIDQKSRRWTYFGRVTKANEYKEADIGGTQTLHNCSPIGTWN
jgi:hypothetical protein